MSSECPCGSGKSFEQCCGPLLGGAPAPTAESLMRSRYTAYVKGEVDYVINTHTPATRGEIDRETTMAWSKESEWLGLTIVNTAAGGPDDQEGFVEFVAKYRAEGHDLSHHERSTFKKVDGRWYYVDGKVIRGTPAKAAATQGRNELCACGSGKKFKKCHGA